LLHRKAQHMLKLQLRWIPCWLRFLRLYFRLWIGYQSTKHRCHIPSLFSYHTSIFDKPQLRSHDHRQCELHLGPIPYSKISFRDSKSMSFETTFMLLSFKKQSERSKLLT
jgi:hypothetical protein